MKLYYNTVDNPDFYDSPSLGNFGDDLNYRFWDLVWPDYDRFTGADWLVGIGSIFTGKLNELPGKKLIMGSGYWPTKYGKPDMSQCIIGFVRGPLTCTELGLDATDAISDSAILTANMGLTSDLPKKGSAFISPP